MPFDPKCIFCKIARGDVASESVYEDDRCVAFRDTDPKAPVHVLVIPRDHIANFSDLESNRDLGGHLAFVAGTVARTEGLLDHGFRLVINQGLDAGQSVGHLHLHVLGGRQFSWPPG